MLAQFQARYPTGSLISELITIYQGKFVVRVAAQVEGVTRATGMAAAETVELAEDNARNRALAVLAIAPAAPQPASATTEPHSLITSVVIPESISPTKSGGKNTGGETPLAPRLSQTTEQKITADQSDKLDFFEYGVTATTPDEELSPNVDDYPTDIGKSNVSTTAATNRQSDLISANVTPSEPATDFDSPDQAVTNKSKAAGNVTPLMPRTATTPASEPIDLSDAIAQTDVELARLRWSKQYGRDYLIRTYNKRSRQQLGRTELLEFLDYLKSQPSP